MLIKFNRTTFLDTNAILAVQNEDDYVKLLVSSDVVDELKSLNRLEGIEVGPNAITISTYSSFYSPMQGCLQDLKVYDLTASEYDDPLYHLELDDLSHHLDEEGVITLYYSSEVEWHPSLKSPGIEYYPPCKNNHGQTRIDIDKDYEHYELLSQTLAKM